MNNQSTYLPLIYRGTSSLRSQNPAVGYAQRLLNKFFSLYNTGNFQCRSNLSHYDQTIINNMINFLKKRGSYPLSVDSKFGQNTETATLSFQRCVFDDNKQWDGKIGNKTWEKLEQLKAYTNPTSIGDATIPNSYLGLHWPDTFWEVEKRSYLYSLKDWKRTFSDYLDDKKRSGLLAVDKAIYDRLMAILPYVWSNIAAIGIGWTYAGGRGISQGFECLFLNPRGVWSELYSNSMKEVHAWFCRDAITEHGPRDCFREIVNTGSGLHVCVTNSGFSEPSIIHIDKNQVVMECVKGWCWPRHLLLDPDSMQHLKDAAPWVIEKWIKSLLG